MLYGRPVWAEIDLSAIRQNMRAIKSLLSPQTRFCPVVKADGYGHGALAVASEAIKLGADYLAVAILDEALSLRSSGFTCPILVLGYTPTSLAALVVANRITQTIYALDQAAALSAAAKAAGLHAKIHLKVDTGMGRLGVFPAEASQLAVAVAALPNLEIEGVYTHFACADSADKSAALRQLAAFQAALSSLQERRINVPIKHCANSAATLDLPQTHLDMVRVGIALYGLWPSAETGQPIDLIPAMRFKARLAQVRAMPAGSAISYGSAYVLPTAGRIATLPVGYADGWSRRLSHKASVVIGGQKVPIVGRICMDQCMADVSALANAQIDDEVLLFGGAKLPAEEIAAHLETINYEVVCMVGKRVPRVYIG